MNSFSNELRVLVVDDDEEIRDVVGTILAGEGYDVRTAGDGLAALAELASADRPGLVLLDLMMPGMNGWELLEEAGRRGLLDEVPFVAMSAAANRDTLPRGVAGFLAKPFTIDALLATVEAHAPRGSGSFLVAGRTRQKLG